MKHQSISLREANQNFSRLIAAVERGETFNITRRGVEVARLLPSPASVQADKAYAPSSKAGPFHKLLTDPAIAADPALAERVLALEARLDKLSSTPPSINEK